MIPLQAVLPAAASGVLIGLAVRAVWPARPDLTSALDRLDARRLPAPAGAGARHERFGARLLAATGGRVPLPLKDLHLLRIPPARHLADRALLMGCGLLVPHLLFGVLALTGATLPYPVVAGVGLLLGAACWQLPGRKVRRAAAEARLLVRHAAASYAERAALARTAGSGAPQPLTGTASECDDRILAALREVCDRAERTGATPWEVLRRLGDDFDIPELTGIPDPPPGEGAASEALSAQARLLRGGLRSDAEAQAREAAAALVAPVTVAVLLLLAFAVIPVVLAITGG